MAEQCSGSKDGDVRIINECMSIFYAPYRAENQLHMAIERTDASCIRLVVRKSPNWGMGPNFDVSAPPTFVTEFSNKLESLNISLVAA